MAIFQRLTPFHQTGLAPGQGLMRCSYGLKPRIWDFRRDQTWLNFPASSGASLHPTWFNGACGGQYQLTFMCPDSVIPDQLYEDEQDEEVKEARGISGITRCDKMCVTGY
jgi:hypothetical protein